MLHVNNSTEDPLNYMMYSPHSTSQIEHVCTYHCNVIQFNDILWLNIRISINLLITPYSAVLNKVRKSFWIKITSNILSTASSPKTRPVPSKSL